MSIIWIASAVFVVAVNVIVFRTLRRLRRRRIRERVLADVRAAIEPWLKPELAEAAPRVEEPPNPGTPRQRMVLGSNDEPSSPRHKWVS